MEEGGERDDTELVRKTCTLDGIRQQSKRATDQLTQLYSTGIQTNLYIYIYISTSIYLKSSVFVCRPLLLFTGLLGQGSPTPGAVGFSSGAVHTGKREQQQQVNRNVAHTNAESGRTLHNSRYTQLRESTSVVVFLQEKIVNTPYAMAEREKTGRQMGFRERQVRSSSFLFFFLITPFCFLFGSWNTNLLQHSAVMCLSLLASLRSVACAIQGDFFSLQELVNSRLWFCGKEPKKINRHWVAFERCRGLDRGFTRCCLNRLYREKTGYRNTVSA